MTWSLPEGAAELVFQVISERNERASLVVTTNLPFGEWTKVFNEPAERDDPGRLLASQLRAERAELALSEEQLEGVIAGLDEHLQRLALLGLLEA